MTAQPARRTLNRKDHPMPATKPTTATVFVYGTMRNGGSLAHHYVPAGTPRTAATVTGTLWAVPHAIPAYPALDVDEPGTVVGEIITLPFADWQALAAMELNAGYDVAFIYATDHDGNQHYAAAFVMDRPNDATVIPSGDWLTYLADRKGA